MRHSAPCSAPSAPLVSSIVALACLSLACVPASVIDVLAFDRQAIFAGEIWRLWTAHVVHFSLPHALLDAAAFFMMGALLEKERGTLRLAVGLLLAAPVISLGLLVAVPDLGFYRGASGIAMMVAILAGAAFWAISASHKMVLALLACGFVLKTTCEAFGIGADFSSLPDHAVVAWQAHVLGAICGAVMALTGTPMRTAAPMHAA